MTYLSHQVGRTLDSPWQTYWMTFRFQNDKTYFGLNMNLEKEITTIYLHNPNGDVLRQIPIIIPNVFSVAKLEDALPLAKRLHGLIAFS
jgi:hypothetical protein